MSTELYTHHYGFTERPFTLLPDPDFLYWSKAHSRAFSVLEYGIMSRAPLTMVTGEVGAGKTTLIQALLDILEDNTIIGLISNAQGDKGDLLRWVLNALGVEHQKGADYVDMHQALQDFCINQYAEGRHVVLVIDEAQNLSIEALEELRMLTNINSNKDELLQLILVGQPELRDMVARPELRQFAQRVAAAYHLKPLDLKTTRAYISHRLLHAGGTGKEISGPAMTRIHEVTTGVPRMINKLCDLALIYGAGADRKAISIALINELVDDEIFVNPLKKPALVLTSDNQISPDLPNAAAE